MTATQPAPWLEPRHPAPFRPLHLASSTPTAPDTPVAVLCSAILAADDDRQLETGVAAPTTVVIAFDLPYVAVRGDTLDVAMP